MERSDAFFAGCGVLFYILGFFMSSASPIDAQTLTLQQRYTNKSYECKCWCGYSVQVVCKVALCAPGLIPNCHTMFQDDCSDSGFGGQCGDFYTWCDALCEVQ